MKITVQSYAEYRKQVGPRHPEVIAQRDTIAQQGAAELQAVIMAHAAGDKVRLPQLRKALGFKPNGNSKIHGSCVSYHPSTCKRGARLAQLEGTVCAGCYAENLSRFYKETDIAWMRNAMLAAELLETGHAAAWVKGMVTVIKATARTKAKRGKPLLHRWFESGDILSDAHLEAIIEVAAQTPEVTHWLPTREQGMVRRVLGRVAMPANLTLRISGDIVGQGVKGINAGLLALGVVASEVTTPGQDTNSHVCPATTTRSSCGDCQACWSRNVPTIAYLKH